ncbi:MAG: TSUP family transporter [Candidatus Eremiobacteraeota bacterium]|nr:TSUP family transporter [Candidatus Eremiobacteraeota bacterium]
MLASRHRERVNFLYGAILGGLGVIGSVPGYFGGSRFTGRLYYCSLREGMLIAAMGMLFMRLPSETEKGKAHWINVAIVGVLLGFLTGFLGVGGGFLIVPALLLGLFAHRSRSELFE